MPVAKKPRKIHQRSLTETEDFNKKLKKRGCIYVARVPPRMTPTKIKALLGEHAEVTRVYLVEEDASVRKRRKKEYGGSGGKRYIEGWVEFASKKKAKHTAAKSMLDKLIAMQQAPGTKGGAAGDSLSAEDASLFKAAKVVELPKDLNAELMSPHDDGINGNPVGDLQEMCMNRRLPPPVYEVGMEKGAPHERCFVIVCSVGGNLKENGSGKSKKLAKRQAANRMLLTLKSMPVERDNEQSLATIDEDDLAQGIARKVAAANKSTDPAADPSFFKFHRDLKTSRGPHLAGLHDQEAFEKAQKDAITALEKIGQEQDFYVTYVDVEEKSRDDKYHCFVQLSTNPVAVCFGVGNTPEDAKANSAANALQYLRIMTK